MSKTRIKPLQRALGFDIEPALQKDSIQYNRLKKGIDSLKRSFTQFTPGALRSDSQFNRRCEQLFEHNAPSIWTGKSDGLVRQKADEEYPCALRYSVESDREILRDQFYELVIEKCRVHHQSQLDKLSAKRRHSEKVQLNDPVRNADEDGAVGQDSPNSFPEDCTLRSDISGTGDDGGRYEGPARDARRRNDQKPPTPETTFRESAIYDQYDQDDMDYEPAESSYETQQKRKRRDSGVAQARKRLLQRNLGGALSRSGSLSAGEGPSGAVGADDEEIHPASQLRQRSPTFSYQSPPRAPLNFARDLHGDQDQGAFIAPAPIPNTRRDLSAEASTIVGQAALEGVSTGRVSFMHPTVTAFSRGRRSETETMIDAVDASEEHSESRSQYTDDHSLLPENDSVAEHDLSDCPNDRHSPELTGTAAPMSEKAKGKRPDREEVQPTQTANTFGSKPTANAGPHLCQATQRDTSASGNDDFEILLVEWRQKGSNSTSFPRLTRSRPGVYEKIISGMPRAFAGRQLCAFGVDVAHLSAMDVIARYGARIQQEDVDDCVRVLMERVLRDDADVRSQWKIFTLTVTA